MSSKGFKHVCCPRCNRKVVAVNFSSHPVLLGQLFCYCEHCLEVMYSETVKDNEPKLFKARMAKRVLLSNNDTFETYQTMHLCIQQYIEFLVAAFNTKKLTNSAMHTIYVHMKHLEKVNNIVVARMRNLDKYRQE